jgi:hypothetical protein
MPLSDFFHAFPKLAGSELRNFTVPPGADSSLPADRYAFIELYCNDKGCDCRRVTIAVFAERQRKYVAYLNLGFDSSDAMAGPFLDPLNPQAPYAQDLLTMLTDMINDDHAYLARLHRHYVMFKEKCEGRPYAGRPFEKPGTVRRIAAERAPGLDDLMRSRVGAGDPIRRESKVGRNDPCPCGSGKKYKQCCLGKPQTAKTQPALAAPIPEPPTTKGGSKPQRTRPTDAQATTAAAKQLVADVVAWRRNPRHQEPWAPAVVRALETNHDLAPALLRLLLSDFAPDGRQQTPPEDYGACLALLNDALTQIRYSVERKRPWAVAMAEQIQTEMAETAFKPEVDARVQQDLIEALHNAKLELHPRIREQALAVAEYYGRFRSGKGAPDLDTLLERLVREARPRDPFDLLDPILAEMGLMPVEGQAVLATGMLASSQPLLNELAVLMLLHPNAEVRTALAEASRHGSLVRRVSALGLRRLIGLRNWLPAGERPAVDALIKDVRLAGVESAPLPPVQPIGVYASTFDGSGAQGVWFFTKDGQHYRIDGVLVKQGLGIREAWGDGGMTKREMEARARAMTADANAVKVHRAYLDLLVAHFIAVGLEQGTPPSPYLMSVAEKAGGDYWKPDRVSLDESIAELEARAPDAFTPERVREAQESAHGWPSYQDFASSWFEDDARVDDLLREQVGRPQDWMLRLPVSLRVIVEEVLEGKRAVWAERLLWMSLWAQAREAQPKVPWQDFLIVAKDLNRGTPLSRIPLMGAIALRTVQSASRRAGKR